MKIPTLDTEGRPNGYIQLIWNANERPELRPDQVYVTAIAPHSRKGPHLHNVRRGVFFILQGEAHIRFRTPKQPEHVYYDWSMEVGAAYKISPKVPCALYNYGDTEALVLNMPSPAWSAEDPDDHPVADWKDPDDWPHSVEPLDKCNVCEGTGIAPLSIETPCALCEGKGSL